MEKPFQYGRNETPSIPEQPFPLQYYVKRNKKLRVIPFLPNLSNPLFSWFRPWLPRSHLPRSVKNLPYASHFFSETFFWQTYVFLFPFRTPNVFQKRKKAQEPFCQKSTNSTPYSPSSANLSKQVLIYADQSSCKLSPRSIEACRDRLNYFQN